MIKIQLMILLFVSYMAGLQAQTCNPVQVYYQKHDGTGTEPFNSGQQAGLNDDAKELAKTFPSPFCENFKVLDYGFSPIWQYTKGGYAEAFEAIKLDAMGASREDSYLLFVREVNQANQVTKIWVDVHLPTTGKFSCLTEMQRNLLKIRIEKAVTENYKLNDNVYFAESRGINVLQQMMKALIEKLNKCCGNKNRTDCDLICPTAAEMKDMLLQEKFISLGPVRIKPKVTPVTTDEPTVINNLMAIEFETENIVTFSDGIAKELAKRKPSKVYLTDDESYCRAEGFEHLIKQYKENLDDYDVILHLSKLDDNGNGELWVRIEGLLFEDEVLGENLNPLRLVRDPQMDKARYKIMYTGLFYVPRRYVNKDLLAYDKRNGLRLFQNVGYPSYIFDGETNLYYGIEPTPLGTIVPSFDIPFSSGSSHTVTLMRLRIKEKEYCYERKNVIWSKATPPLNAKNLPGQWEDLCKNAKPTDPNDVANWQKMQDVLVKYNVEKTFFKHISANPNNKPTYISKDGIGTAAPYAGTATIIEIKENGGSITPKVTMRTPIQKSITRDKGKGKSGTWSPIEAKPAFEAAFKEAIKDFAEQQGNTDYEPKINPSTKREARTELKDGWGGLPTGVSPGIEYKGVDILEMLAAGVKTFNEVVDNAKIPDEMWQNPDADDFPVKDKVIYPSGVLNGGMSELKGGVETFGMIADAVMNPVKTGKELAGFASGLTNWDGATSAAGGFITGIIGLDLDEYNKGPEHQRHASGVVIGTIAAQAVTGSFVLSLTDIKNAPAKFGKITDKLKSFSKEAREKYSETLSDMAETTSKDLKSPCDVECLLGKVGCLTGNTLIETNEGEMQPLNAVKEGDLVNSYNHSTQQKELKSISKIQRFFVNNIMVLTLSTGNVIEATPNHPFYVRGEYRQAQDLRLGDTLFSKNDKIITLNRIFAKDTTVEVFNLLVADNDNYFAGADAVLNTRCPLEVIRDNFKTLEANLLKDAISANLRGKFIDYASKLPDADLDGFLKIFNGTSENAIRAWEKLFELTGTKAWVSKSEAVIKKLDADPAKIDGVKDYYSGHQSKADVTTYPSTSITGQYYDEFGHPDFTKDVKKIKRKNGTDGRSAYEPTGGITGNRATDAKNANEWAASQFEADEFKYTSGSNECRIKDPSSPHAELDGYVICTWHHHQDGKTMMAVPKKIHGSSNASHIGGVQAKDAGIIGFFESPQFPN